MLPTRTDTPASPGQVTSRPHPVIPTGRLDALSDLQGTP